MEGMQNTSLVNTALQNPSKILIYYRVNSGFFELLRLVFPSLWHFA